MYQSNNDLTHFCSQQDIPSPLHLKRRLLYGLRLGCSVRITCCRTASYIGFERSNATHISALTFLTLIVRMFIQQYEQLLPGFPFSCLTDGGKTKTRRNDKCDSTLYGRYFIICWLCLVQIHQQQVYSWIILT